MTLTTGSTRRHRHAAAGPAAGRSGRRSGGGWPMAAVARRGRSSCSSCRSAGRHRRCTSLHASPPLRHRRRCRSTCCSATPARSPSATPAFVGIGAFTVGLPGHRAGPVVLGRGRLAVAAIGGLAGAGPRRRVAARHAACTSRCHAGRTGLVAEQNIFQHPGLHRRWRRSARRRSPAWFDTDVALLLPVPGLPGRRALRRLAADAHQGRAGAAGAAREPAGGLDLRHQRADGYTLFAFVVSGVFAGLGRCAARPRRRRRCRPTCANFQLVARVRDHDGRRRPAQPAGVVHRSARSSPCCRYIIEKLPGLEELLTKIPGPVDLSPELAHADHRTAAAAAQR